MSERFDKAAAEWDKGDVRQNIAGAVFQTLVSRIALLNNMNIMDFGSGTGLLSFKIAPMVRSVSGIDLSIKMLEQMESKNTDEIKVRGICQDILRNPLDEKFSGIVSSMAMHHVEDTAELFRSFYNHLKRDGFVAIADLDREDGTFHKQHGNEGVYHFGFDREALRGIIEECGFSNVRFQTAYTVENETGKYPIFLVTALKRR